MISALALLALAIAGAWFIWGDRHAGEVLAIVEDDARLVSPQQREFVARYHRYLLQDHDIDYRIEISGGVGDVNVHAVRRFAALGVGGLSHTGRGLLLLIDPDQDRVRLEVGQTLEGVFPDAFVAYVEQRQMVPFFRDNRVAAGILATTELLITRIQNAKANAGYETESWFVGSAGGGATAVAQLDAGHEAPAPRGADVVPGDTPEATVGHYLRTMQARNASPDLSLYTAASREMLRGWTVTPAQMDNVVRTYRECSPEPVRIDATGRYAVIRYPVAQRQCSPWFLTRADGRWQLDLSMLQGAVRFGRDNSWHFELRVSHPYQFAFADWQFDSRGYPR